MEHDVLMHTYTPNGVRTMEDLVLTHGQGAWLFDANGKKYLDFFSGIAVNILGHSDSEWCAAIADQASKLTHVSNLFHSTPPLELAQLLVEHSTFDKVFFCNSGTEANEAAYKFARLYGAQQSTTKNKFIAFKGGFHGRTAAALSLTFKPAIREPFLPLVPGIAFADFNNLESVEKLMDEDVAAVFVEPIQGEGGVVPAQKEFLQGLRTLCTAHDTLMICDEVQCGLGRTGYLFAHEPYEIEPDMITLAKPLAGGLPIGAVLAKEHVAKAVTPGMHGTTFGGNALVCRAALVVAERLIQDGFLPRVRDRGQQLSHRLHQLAQKHPKTIRQVRLPLGEAGLFAGIECYMSVGPVVREAAKRGLLVISAGETYVLALVQHLLKRMS